MKSNSLALNALVIARDGATLTAPITLELTGGELLAIHGSNGSGKSTLLKTIAGLIPPHRAFQHTSAFNLVSQGATGKPLPAGEVGFAQSPLQRLEANPGEGASPNAPVLGAVTPAATGAPLPPGEAETLLGVSGEGDFSSEGVSSPALHPILYNGAWPITPRPVYLGHKRGLTPSMSVLENVAFWAKASDHPELTDAALHYFELADIPNVPVESLSAGWQQRVALTRLITMPSGVWLLDEPTSNLDAEGINLLHSLVQTRLEQGGIVLIATHLQLQGEKVRELNINSLNREAEVKPSC